MVKKGLAHISTDTAKLFSECVNTDSRTKYLKKTSMMKTPLLEMLQMTIMEKCKLKI
jgi:hypothetical protein